MSSLPRAGGQTAGYVVAALMFAAVGVLVGYFVYASGGGDWSFRYWIWQPVRRGWWTWAAAGALFGLGARYLMVRR